MGSRFGGRGQFGQRDFRRRQFGFEGLDPLSRVPDSPDESVFDQLYEANFFISLDGYPTGATYFKTGPEIIQSVLEDHIGIAAGDIDSTSFTNADTDSQVSELGLYLASLTNTKRVLSDLARYSFGFLHIGQDGKFKMNVVKSSYNSGDVDFTIPYRAIKDLKNDVNFQRIPLGQVSKNIFFNYLYSFATDDYQSQLEKTTTSSLNIQQVDEFCRYCINDDIADTIAKFFCGDGGTLGQYGKLRIVPEITIYDPEFHFAELGDIIQFSSDWDTHIDAYGGTLSNLYFMLMAKQFGNKEITLRLLEVG